MMGRGHWQRQRCVALRTVLSVGALLAAMVAVADLSTHYAGPFGDATGQGQTYGTLASALGGAVVGVSLLTVMVWIGWTSRMERYRFSSLYWGVLITAIGATIVLVLNGANAYGLIHNDLHQRWRWPTEPEVRLLQALGFNIFIGGLALKVMMFLRGGGVSWRRIAVLFGAIFVLTVAILAAAAWG